MSAPLQTPLWSTRRARGCRDFGCRERTVVDTDFVDESSEELTAGERLVATDAQRLRADGDRAGLRAVRHFDAVDVDPLSGAVVGDGHMRPDVQRQRRGAADRLIDVAVALIARGYREAARLRRTVIRVDAVGERVGPA